jgi:peptide subunit release factor 1 (eRF1)
MCYQEDCRSKGSNLVTIESTDENEWLKSRFTGMYMILEMKTIG